MKGALTTIRDTSILTVLRYSDVFLTLFILSKGGIELNPLWAFLLEIDFSLVIVFVNIPIIVYFLLDTHRGLYYQTFVGFHFVLIVYELILIFFILFN